MDTLVYDKGDSAYLVNAARVIKTPEELEERASRTVAGADWADATDKNHNPFVMWIGGDFVEADNPNQNRQFWTAGDLELAEYSIKFAPLNMVHKFRQPVGFYAATQSIKLERTEDAASQGSMKIQALSGLWTHIFPQEAAQAQAADEAGLLFYSMECRGTHLTCASDEAKGLIGCGNTYEYAKVTDHCEHLQKRTSVRHIVNPTFRGGALIVPPVKPGWQNAHANVLTDSVMQEAAAFAEENQAQYDLLTKDGADLTTSAWEQLMGLVIASAR